MTKCQEGDAVPETASRMTQSEIQSYRESKRTDFNAWVATKADAYSPVRAKVYKAVSSSNNLIKQFAAENIMLGITQAGKTKLIADTFKEVFYYAQTGSLYECLSSLDAIVITPEMSPFLTEARRTDLRNKLLNLLANL